VSKVIFIIINFVISNIIDNVKKNIFQFFPMLITFDFVALLKRQGVNVKGLLKADPVREEPQPHIDCTGHLQVLC